MSTISNRLPLTDLSNRYNPTTKQAAAYIKEQSVNFRENLSTSLSLETRDGDRITLSSSSYAQMDAYLYDSRGIIATDSGFAAASMSQREITLASGQSFAFTVEGNLSEEELQDIESLLSGLDGIITEMKDGDMDEAFSQALKLGGYATVSNFAADIRLEQSYEMRSAITATAAGFIPETEAGAEEPSQSDDTSPATAPTTAKGHKYGHLDAFEKFFAKLADQLEKHDDKLVGIAREPIGKLFNHHQDEMDESKNAGLYAIIDKAMGEIDALIEEIIGSRFDKQIDEAAPATGSEQAAIENE